MAQLKDDHIIPRVVKKKTAPQAPHGGAWKVAYADFVTAMMALFIVLWITSQSQALRESVAQYFKNPGVLTGSNAMFETSDAGGKLPTVGFSQELQMPLPASPQQTQGSEKLQEVKRHIQEIIARLPEVQQQVKLTVTQEGLKIELMEQKEPVFFDLGSADLKPQAQKLLTMLAQELGPLPHTLMVEGHTDSRPYGTAAYTNWELSTDRAQAARRFLEGAGIPPARFLTVRGFADRQPLKPEDPLDYRNRRVSIVVMNPENQAPQSRSRLSSASPTPFRGVILPATGMLPPGSTPSP